MPNKIYNNPETTLTWTDTGGDNALDLGALAADAVRVGAQDDLGAAAKSSLYFWQLKIDGFDTAPVVGETIDVYLAYAHNTSSVIDGDVGASDAAGATVDLPNLHYIGSAVVQTTTAGDNLVISGIVEIRARYVSPVVHNNTVDALLSTSDAHTFTLTPVPDEVQ